MRLLAERSRPAGLLAAAKNKQLQNSNSKTQQIQRNKKVSWQLLRALEYVHSLWLIHADLKPENVLIKSYSRRRNAQGGEGVRSVFENYSHPESRSLEPFEGILRATRVMLPGLETLPLKCLNFECTRTDRMPNSRILTSSPNQQPNGLTTYTSACTNDPTACTDCLFHPAVPNRGLCQTTYPVNHHSCVRPLHRLSLALHTSMSASGGESRLRGRKTDSAATTVTAAATDNR